MKSPASRTTPMTGGDAQWAVPQADLDHWLADGSFATGQQAFRAAMRQHAKGVAVVTTGLDEPVGFCATSLASISLDPPMVAFTVGLTSSSWPIVRGARHVMVHLLAEDQGELAHRFSQKAVPRFGAATSWHRDSFGLPVLDDVLAWLVVTPATLLTVADHALVIGRVVASRHSADRDPLVHLRGEFRSMTGADQQARAR